LAARRPALSRPSGFDPVPEPGNRFLRYDRADEFFRRDAGVHAPLRW
jgi:hypothetical protein